MIFDRQEVDIFEYLRSKQIKEVPSKSQLLSNTNPQQPIKSIPFPKPPLDSSSVPAHSASSSTNSTSNVNPQSSTNIQQSVSTNNEEKDSLGHLPTFQTMQQVNDFIDSDEDSVMTSIQQAADKVSEEDKKEIESSPSIETSNNDKKEETSADNVQPIRNEMNDTHTKSIKRLSLYAFI